MLYCLIFLAHFTVGLTPDTLGIEGRWVCDTKTGKFDDFSSYEVFCGGEITFMPDHTLQSTCTDAFMPNGSVWAQIDQTLLLSDSEGRGFAEYHIQRLDDSRLVLIRKEVAYTFRRK